MTNMYNTLLKHNTSFGIFHLWPDDTIGKHLLEGKFWDEHFKSTFDEVDCKSTVIDVGANIGTFSIYAAKRGCFVHAFEASKKNFDVLMMNIQENNLESTIVAYNEILFDSEVDMKYYAGSPTNPSCFAVEPTLDKANSIGTTKILDSYNFDNVSLIKIDTQGCDLRVLKGARETILRCRPILCYEIEYSMHIVYPDTDDMYINFISEIGYNSKLVVDTRSINYDYVAKPKENTNV